MNEKQWQRNVIDLAQMCGWMVYHTYDSRRSEPGFPDLVLAHPDHGVMFRELKTNKGVTTARQVQWLVRLRDAGGDADIWRPKDLDRVQKELRRGY